MKNMTIYKDLKFDGKSMELQYKKEMLYQFKAKNHVDEMQIEYILEKLKHDVKTYNHVKKHFDHVANHTIKHDVNGVTLNIDSMYERESFPIKKEFLFTHFLQNQIILI